MKMFKKWWLIFLIPAAVYGVSSVMGLGPTPYNPYGVSPILWVTNGPTVLGKFGCIGDGTLTNDISCYPTPGRVLTISGRDPASPIDHYAIGADIHPSLIATANGQALVGLWVDPQIDNSGNSGFNCGIFTGCKTAGFVNVQSLEQRGPAMVMGDIVGLENGGKSASGGNFEYKILGVGNVMSRAQQAYDLASNNGHGLVGVEILPAFRNTGVASTPLSAVYGADIRVASQSSTTNELLQQVGLHVQDGTADQNTIVDNKKALLIEKQSGGRDSNYGVYDMNTGYFGGGGTIASHHTREQLVVQPGDDAGGRQLRLCVCRAEQMAALGVGGLLSYGPRRDTQGDATKQPSADCLRSLRGQTRSAVYPSSTPP